MRYVLPALLCMAIWFPEISHYYVPHMAISDEILGSGRQMPADPVLEELKGFHYLRRDWRDDTQLIRAAEKLVRGEVEIPDYPTTKIKMPFDPNDIDQGLPRWQLELAGLIVPEILLRAYEVTGREEFFVTARDVILGWAAYERRAWLPRGYLWNDHALAKRVTVLAEFWRLYRHRPDYQAGVARVVWLLAARSGEFLAKPSHFTFATNHGVMQNLALLHICLAFPTLPRVANYRQLAIDRLRDQMGFYVNREGVVLEHSAEYHEFGLQLMGMAFRYLSLLNEPIPDEWRLKYERAKEFYAQLRLPDASLPMLGDTDGRAEVSGPPIATVDAGRTGELVRRESWIPRQPFSLYPVAGYSIWWDGLDTWSETNKLHQTLVTWSYHPGHGHKFADEMSVLLWAGGQAWWTNVGYWPYGVEGRNQAESWTGSNSPHLVGEGASSVRAARLLSIGQSDHLAAIELERAGPGEYAARRQVLHLKPNVWLVVDHTMGDEQSRTTTTWTTAHNVRLGTGSIPTSFTLEVEGQKLKLAAFFLGSAGTTIKQSRGSLYPFAGWQAVHGVPKEASALVVEQPARDSWSAAVWLLSDGEGLSEPPISQPPQMRWDNAQDWRISLPLRSGALKICRNGENVVIRDSSGADHREAVKLAQPPDTTRQAEELRDRYRTAASKYPRFRDLFTYRLKVTYVLIGVFLLQEAVFSTYKKMRGKYYTAMQALNLFGWVGVAVWLLFFYFRVG